MQRFILRNKNPITLISAILISTGFIAKWTAGNMTVFNTTMIIASILLALIISSVTEKIIVPRLGHYELMDETEDYLTKKEKRGLLISLFFGVIYIIIISFTFMKLLQ